MKVKSESEVAWSCPTLSDPMEHSLPGSSVHRILQAGVLEWGAIAFSAPYMLVVFYCEGLGLSLFCMLAFPWGWEITPLGANQMWRRHWR